MAHAAQLSHGQLLQQCCILPPHSLLIYTALCLRLQLVPETAFALLLAQVPQSIRQYTSGYGHQHWTTEWPRGPEPGTFRRFGFQFRVSSIPAGLVVKPVSGPEGSGSFSQRRNLPEPVSGPCRPCNLLYNQWNVPSWRPWPFRSLIKIL